MFRRAFLLFSFLAAAGSLTAVVALVVPTDVQMPGTQPQEIQQLKKSDNCGGCHGDYDLTAEPFRPWEGGMMAHAGRDPLFWACLAIAEQDFDGSGDLCIRCHAPAGWLDGTSEPTDGSALRDDDAEGVGCHFCHQLTDPDGQEHFGVQVPPFVANTGGPNPEAYLGNGMYVMSPDLNRRLGPYANAVPPHQFAQSEFHRSSELCGTCHDVSNPVTGDLAHNHGAMQPLAPGDFSGQLGGPVADKAAFKNLPFLYGIIERTFSEHAASDLAGTLVSDFPTLPADLQDGILQYVYDAALVAGQGGDYEDGTPRYFTCQSCHMPPVTGKGCDDNNAPIRKDLPFHDLTGGNTWAPDAIQYLDNQGLVDPGGGLSQETKDAMDVGKLRARQTLQRAAALSLQGDTLKVVNLTGHKLISGYPEGRRMWLNRKWYDAGDQLVREDGAYGPMAVTVQGQQHSVDTILDLNDPNLRIYEAHMAMTQEWANQLLGFGYSGSMVLGYDRVTGLPDYTLADLAAQAPGTYHETFHFVLNNLVASDNRIPPYGFDFDEAKLRNALPVPATQYGDPGPGGKYHYWDEVALDPPAAAVRGEISLMYQTTSWEYVQFLLLANDGSVAFLANRGQELFDAWLNTGMSAPEVMETITWTGSGPPPPTLSVSGLVAGNTATFTISNATPSGRVNLAYSLAGGGPVSLPAGACGTLLVSLTPPIGVLGSALADPSGTATISIPVPPAAAGFSIWFQALDNSSCELTNGLAEVVG